MARILQSTLATILVRAEEIFKCLLKSKKFLVQRSHQLLEELNQKHVEAKKMQYFTQLHFHISTS